MWPYYPELLATPVPRYTSFPTAAEFGDDVGGEDFRAALERVTGDVSLYVHIPFCEKICWYCGCNTAAANPSDRLDAYLEALDQEIALVGEHLPRSARVTRGAFGGGSPTAISPLDVARLVDALTLHFRLDRPELSIELDPRTLSAGWGAAISGTGVTRASMGVQTFSPRLQEAIGRVQPFSDIARGTQLLRTAGISSLNFDLMYGLPGQTDSDLEDTLARAVALGADRLAVFGYAHVPHLIPRQRRIVAHDLPDQHARFDMAAHAYEMLTGSGYAAVGFDHFARPGDPMARAAAAGNLRRNFQGFTDDRADVLIGLGASAISSFPGLLAQNEKNAGRYRMLLSQSHFSATRGVRRSAEDVRRGKAIEALLCTGHADLDRSLSREAAPRLALFITAGLVELTDEGCTIAPAGLPYARGIAAAFDPYRQDSARRFSSAV